MLQTFIFMLTELHSHLSSSHSGHVDEINQIIYRKSLINRDEIGFRKTV